MDAYRTREGWKPKTDVTILKISPKSKGAKRSKQIKAGRRKRTTHSASVVFIRSTKVVAPDRFLIKEAPSNLSQSSRDFVVMERKLKQFMSRRDAEPVNPPLPEIGVNILVKKPMDSDWYRARVCRILDTVKGYEVEVTLVDYGETFVADRRLIRIVPDAVFSAVPFQCIEFLLPGLVPLKLTIDVETVMAHKPSKTWDTAAVEYVKSLVNGAGAAHVQVFGKTRSGGLFGKLLVRCGNTFTSIADDLVLQKYATLDTLTPNPELLTEPEEHESPEKSRAYGVDEDGLSPVSGSLGTKVSPQSWARREQEHALRCDIRELLDDAPTVSTGVPLENLDAEHSVNANVESSPAMSPTPATSLCHSLSSETLFSDTSTVVPSVQGLGRGIAALLKNRQSDGIPLLGAGPSVAPTASPHLRADCGNGGASLLHPDIGSQHGFNSGSRLGPDTGIQHCPDVGSQPGSDSGSRLHADIGSPPGPDVKSPLGPNAATSSIPIAQTSSSRPRTDSGSSSHSLPPPNLGTRISALFSATDHVSSDSDASMKSQLVDDATSLDVGVRARMRTSPSAALSEILRLGRGAGTKGGELKHMPRSSKADLEDSKAIAPAPEDDAVLPETSSVLGKGTFAVPVTPNLPQAELGTGKMLSPGRSFASPGTAAPMVFCLGRGLRLPLRLTTRSPGPVSKSLSPSQFEDIHEEPAKTPSEENASWNAPVVSCLSPPPVSAETSTERGARLSKLKDLLARRSVPLASGSGSDSASPPAALEATVRPAPTVFQSPKGQEAKWENPAPETTSFQPAPTCLQPAPTSSQPTPTSSQQAPTSSQLAPTSSQLAPTGSQPAPNDSSPSRAERLRSLLQSAKASSGSVHRGCESTKSNCSEEGSASSPPSLEKPPQPPGSREPPSSRAGDNLAPLDYSDFMKQYVSDEEDLDPTEEENKWSLKFSARGDHQDLITLNARRGAEDVRCRDLQSFSDVPSDLEPYTQFEGEIDFKTVFEPSHWSSLVAGRTVRALCHGSALPRLVSSLDQIPFQDALRARLCSLGFRGPSCIQSVAWPAVLSGRTVVAVGSPHSGKTLSYLLPLVSRLTSESDYRHLPVSSGPLVLVLSSTWKGAQRIYDQFKLLTQDSKIPKCGVLYAGGSEAGKEVQLVNGVEVLIATPLCLLRVMRKYDHLVVNLKRCCHLVLDDGERLIEEFTEEVRQVLQEYSEALRKRASRCLLNQMVVCTSRWTEGMDSLLRLLQVQHSPVVLFSSFAEAAVYARVPTFVRYVDPKARDATLLELLEGSRGRKAVVCTSSHESALKVHRLLRSESVFALLLHDGLPMASVRGVANEWAAPHKDTCAPVLVAQDNILSWAGIRDAAVLVHYDVPELSRFNFGFRFSCLAERMRSFDAKGDSDPRDSPLAHLILTRDNAHLSVQLAEFLTRVGAKVPPAFEQLVNQELQRRACNPERPLCAHLKSFGRCLAPPTTSGTACRDRHGVVAALDRPRDWRHLPASGEVRIFVTKMVDATHFYAWVLEHWDPTADLTAGKGGAAVVHTEFQEAMLEMNAYFAVPGGDRHVGLGENETPAVGGVYAVEVDADQFHRVQVVSLMSESGSAGCSPLRAEVFHMDHGGSSRVALRRLLRLPERLAQLPPFAVEVFCCRVQPQDRDLEWTFQAECTSHSLVTEKELVGKVVLCLGNTLWLDPLVKRTHLDQIGVTVNERHVRSCLISQGMACDNPDHVTQLRKLAADAGLDLPPITPARKPRAGGTYHNGAGGPRYAFLEPDCYTKVYLWKVVSPDLFYVQIAKFAECLEDLEDTIEKHMSEGGPEWLDPAHVGDPCIARFENKRWYRAHVERIADDGNVEVFFPDYGDTAVCRLEELYALPPQMLLLPLQGIQCRLAGVAPASDQWTLEASSALEDFGYNADNLNKILLLRVLRKAEGHRPGSSCYEVLLFDQCGEDNVNIANELVKCGVARASELPVPDLDAEALQPPPLEEVQGSSPSASESDNHSCEENMKEYMDQLYGHIRKELLREMESELSAAEKEAATALGKKPAPTTPAKKETPRITDRPEASKASPPSKMPLLESTLLSPSRQRQPVLWWWEDRHHVYVEVRFEGTRDYELRLSSTSFYLRFQWKGQEYATHETLHAPILPKASNLEPRAKALRLTLVKAVASQTWNYLTDRHCRVGYIRYSLDHIVDSDEEVDKYKSPYPPGYVRGSKILPYDEVAHEERQMELEASEEHVHAPLDDVYHSRDPNNLFASL